MEPPITETPVENGIPPLRVLYVDDMHDVADSAVDLLRLVGFEAQACYDGYSALVLADDFHPSLCLIDLNMPGMDGDELAVRLRERATDGRPVLVAVTAQSDRESRERIRLAGFDLHLVKPVDPRNLLAVVDTLWRVWGQVRAGTARPSELLAKMDGGH